jgi:hypothetical protein
VFRHVVLFRWADHVDDAHVDRVAAGLDGLPGTISEIRAYHHGRDAGLADTNYDYVVVGDFDDEAAYLTYRDHPVHRKLVDDLFTGNVAERAAVQYGYELVSDTSEPN